MKKKVTTKLTITRMGDKILIFVEDGLTLQRIVDTEVSLSEFTKALTGLGAVSSFSTIYQGAPE
jgi:hypothetical protein